ncbi:hypothetical protein [Calothrix sp. PCC 7507]|uniref:hypothetical protein n=1 Tax=Calothrix sp. PCC 7507 TaxID=99598 RepID=UPI00135F1A77|nr:hypothetical protein [Calothrix sp. PCC 7507]
MRGFPALRGVALGIAHQNHDTVGNAHPTDTEIFSIIKQASDRLRISAQLKSDRTF